VIPGWHSGDRLHAVRHHGSHHRPGSSQKYEPENAKRLALILDNRFPITVPGDKVVLDCSFSSHSNPFRNTA